MKTRCDFDKSKGKCYRCVVLRLECSLEGVTSGEDDQQQQQKREEQIKREEQNGTSSNGEIERMLRKVSDQLDRLESRGGGLDGGKQGQGEIGFERGFEGLDAPLQIIRQIDHRLFQRGERYDQMREACDELTVWIGQRRDYCDQVLRKFEQKCEDFLVQGEEGVRQRATEGLELSRQELIYGNDKRVPGSLTDGPGGPSSLLYAVLVLQGMRCDEGSAHEETQPELFKMIRRALSATLITTPLRLPDIEAVLYTAVYNAARKPRQPILDSWLLTGYGITLLLSSVDVRGAIEVVTMAREEDENMGAGRALYIFRLFNELALCHLQYALSLGKPIHVPADLLSQSAFITAARNHTKRDAITAAEIRLLSTLARVISSSSNSTAAFQSWRADYQELFTCDKYNQLEVGFHYSHLLLCTRKLKTSPDDTEIARRAIDHANCIVKGFLQLTSNQVEALPNYPLCVLVFGCLTLCRLVSSSVGNRHAQISMVTQVYWYLYHIGERPRDIVYTIANIIKSLVEGTGSSTDEMDSTTDVGTKRTFEQVDDQLSMELQNLPDISQYSTYDEFFEGIFSYMNGIDVNYPPI